MKRKVPIAVLVSVAVIGTLMTAFADMAGKKAAQAQFDLIASEAADRLASRANQNLQLLSATAAYLAVSGAPLDRAGFGSFVKALNIGKNYIGVFGAGFALVTDPEHENSVSSVISANYGVNSMVWPKGTDTFRTAIVLREPYDKSSQKVLGYDMYSEPVRREAMNRAMRTGEIAASGPVELIQDAGKAAHPGFLAYLPVKLPVLDGVFGRNSDYQGLVFATFRIADLHDIAFADAKLPAAYKTVDRDFPEKALAESADYSSVAARHGFYAERDIAVGGRHWTLQLAATDKFEGSNWRLATMLLGVVSLLLAAALATSTRAQFVAIETAHKLADVSLKAKQDAERAAQDKDLMLQEMKHRIKNSIARVLAIARQTASGSRDLAEFSTSYFARLQSMAASQELLTRSHWHRADIADILAAELSQVLGDAFARDRLSGVTMMLNERATQALGLTFHELATNALKYGDLAGIRGGLTVDWFVKGHGAEEKLVVVWNEPSGKGAQGEEEKQAAPGGGFGSRLIAMSVERELGGTITREAGPEGLVIRLELPVKSVT